MKHLSAGLSVLTVLACLPAAFAGWPIDPTINVNIVSRAADQTLPKISPTPDGGCYIGWHDPASGNYDTYLQRLDANGNAVWAANGILISDNPQGSSLVDWDMITDANGNAVLVFTDTRDGADRDVFAYRVDADGNQLWGPNGVLLSQNDDFEAAPKAAQVSDGSFVFVWLNSPDAADGALLYQNVSEAGIAQFPSPIAIVAVPGEDPGFNRVVPAGNDQFIVSWVRDIGTFLSPRHVRAQKFDLDGTALWNGGTALNVYDVNSVPIAHTPALIADGTGGAIVGWHRSLGNLFNCLAQHIDANGNELLPHNGQVVTTEATQNHLDPAFAHNESTGDIFVFWNNRNGAQSQWGIRAQRIDSAGMLAWGSNGVEIEPLNTINKSLPRAVPIADGAAVCYFYELSFGNDQIRTVRLANDGSSVWGASPSILSDAVSDKSRLPIAITANDVVIATWEDDRNGSRDIYAQNINRGGSLGILGDLNCDGVVSVSDIAPFVLALTDPANYPVQFPACDIGHADINGDTLISVGDIGAFVALLTQ